MRRHSAEHCRKQAAECRRLASVAVNPKERSRWLSLAKLWARSAAELDNPAALETAGSAEDKGHNDK